MSRRRALGALLLLWLPAAAAGATCETRDMQVQVLGSGGPELAGGRASSGYLVWLDGKPRLLVDIGGGAALRFAESGANVADLDALLFTRLHAGHSAGLPALVQASSFEHRARPLPIYGPPSNRLMPSTVTFVREMFDSTRGVYRYLGGFVSPMARDTYKLEPHDVQEKPRKLGLPGKQGEEIVAVFANERLRVTAAPAVPGDIPALAFRVEAGGRSVVFSVEAGGEGRLARLAAGADLLVAPDALPEGAQGAERGLPAPPSIIGRIAREANVKRLVLSHRTRRTLGREEETLEQIRRHYAGPVAFANDLDCFTP